MERESHHHSGDHRGDSLRSAAGDHPSPVNFRPSTASGRPPFMPSMDMKEIFREMIRQEVQCGRHSRVKPACGRLTRWRRRRIVQYAAGMGLSAVQAGRLVEECQAEVRRQWRSFDPSGLPDQWGKPRLSVVGRHPQRGHFRPRSIILIASVALSAWIVFIAISR